MKVTTARRRISIKPRPAMIALSAPLTPSLIDAVDVV